MSLRKKNPHKRKAIVSLGAAALSGVLVFASVRHAQRERARIKIEHQQFQQRQELQRLKFEEQRQRMNDEYERELREYRMEHEKEQNISPPSTNAPPKKSIRIRPGEISNIASSNKRSKNSRKV